MTRFSVPDMMCDRCVASISGAVRALDPAARVQADLAAHTVTIESATAAAALKDAIEAAGFTVGPAA
jgi:copper chaperone